MNCVRCKAPSDTKTCTLCKAKANKTRKTPLCTHFVKRNTCVICNPKGYIDFILSKLLVSCKITDTKKGHLYNLDLEWCYKMYTLQNHCCYHCNTFLSITCGSKNKDQISIDRVDNSKGHCKGNVVLACLGCNLVKRDKAFSDFNSKEDKVLKPDQNIEALKNVSRCLLKTISDSSITEGYSFIIENEGVNEEILKHIITVLENKTHIEKPGLLSWLW